jgi:hypothetical protein
MNNGEPKYKPKKQSYKIKKERQPKEPTFKLPRECIEFHKFLKTHIYDYVNNKDNNNINA